MTIIKKKGNLLDAKGIIVHGCNCQGVMGSGVALAIKNKWPQAFRIYRTWYEGSLLTLGATNGLFVENDEVLLINAMTQYSYGREPGRRYVEYEAVEACFKKVKRCAEAYELPVNFPKIGAGLGGGDWDIISTIIDKTLGDDIEKILWIP